LIGLLRNQGRLTKHTQNRSELMNATPIIALIDDSEALRGSLRTFLGAHDLDVRTFASWREFVCQGHTSRSDCIVLNIRMPDMTWSDLMNMLWYRGEIPVIFFSSHQERRNQRCTSTLAVIGILDRSAPQAGLLPAIRLALAKSAKS
jgi:two-component system, LuxR family, response regulator FixJ